MTAGTAPTLVSSGPGLWLAAFTGWLTFSLPFSSWKGGSFAAFSSTWLKSVVFFLLVGGLIFSVGQFRKLVFWMAMANVTVMYNTLRSGSNAVDDRYSVTYGTLGNANDLAGALLMGLPYLIYVGTDKRRNFFLRLVCWGFALLLFALVARTGSRGGLLAGLALVIIVFVKASAGNKLKMLVLCGVAMACLPFIVSRNLIERYATMLHSTDAPAKSMDVESANESTNARRGLMKLALLLTLRHPVFGVGIGQFTYQAVDLSISRGESPLWFTCHDIYLLVSSETGLPGFFCYMAVIVSMYRILFRLQRGKDRGPDQKEVADLAFCMLASLTAFLVCGVFNTSAYTSQIPMLAGLISALDRVSAPVLQEQQLPAPVALPFYTAGRRLNPRPLPRALA